MLPCETRAGQQIGNFGGAPVVPDLPARRRVSGARHVGDGAASRGQGGGGRGAPSPPLARAVRLQWRSVYSLALRPRPCASSVPHEKYATGRPALLAGRSCAYSRRPEFLAGVATLPRSQAQRGETVTDAVRSAVPPDHDFRAWPAKVRPSSGAWLWLGD